MMITALSKTINEESIFKIVDRLSMSAYDVYAIMLNKLFNMGPFGNV